MPNIELLKADVADQLQKVSRLEEEFGKVERLLSAPVDAVDFYDRAAVGYYLHSFYNGCENIFRSIAAFFENELDSDKWHADLLRRMTLDIEGYRPSVIDQDLYLLLQDFKGFRHVFRHTYAFELDWERERLVAGKFRQAAQLLHEQVEAFMDRLASLEE
jgi:hypothetical protein